MKRWLYYALPSLMFAVAIILAFYGPDLLSKSIVGLMVVVIALSLVMGIAPLVQFIQGFETGEENIKAARLQQPNMPWTAVAKMTEFFNNKWMDRRFDEYKSKIEIERKNGMIVGSVEDIINEDEIALKTWNGLMLQVPGTLTGLGLIGTFVGLITGISGVQVSSVDATLTSIQSLLEGIHVAFYTSICGVILSILFNIVYKVYWNIMLRSLGVFVSMFHRSVIPTVDEQTRYTNKREMNEILKRIKAIPSSGEFSLNNVDSQNPMSTKNEAVMMPMILDALDNNEFIFYLQPTFDINTRKVIGGDALVRWKHKEMGLVSPGVFVPLLEKNGFITKLDQHIWNKVAGYIRDLIDQGIQPVPISVNVSKTDILALDMPEVMSKMIQSYKIPPKYIHLDIAQNAYLECHDICLEMEKKLQAMGFRVSIDGFNGDFFTLYSGRTAPAADTYKLDLRICKQEEQITPVVKKAADLRVELTVEGIENMKQLALLRKSGIREGQGFYLSNALPVEEFEKKMEWRRENG